MVGEKYVNPEYYEGGRNVNEKDIGDDQGIWISDDLDNNRNTGPVGVGGLSIAPPLQDQLGVKGELSFGSAHPGTFQMSMCDASVRAVSYEIDLKLHDAFGTRAGGESLSGGL
jgi:hypothetical protein